PNIVAADQERFRFVEVDTGEYRQCRGEAGGVGQAALKRRQPQRRSTGYAPISANKPHSNTTIAHEWNSIRKCTLAGRWAIPERDTRPLPSGNAILIPV